MNDTQTAATQALEVSGPEVENKMAVRMDWSPQVFRAEVEREKQMRSVMHEYMSEAMVAGHHYYSFKDGDKPAITQEGAHAIVSLMKCVIGPPEISETYHDDGHLSVRVRVNIFNQSGALIATGDGICSTRESKYAYRWIWDNEVPNGVDVSTLKSKTGTKKHGGTWTQYQMPNQDLPDLYNTVLKMAVKRAKVAGVRQLPLVSELFVAEEDVQPNAERMTREAGPSETPKGEPREYGKKIKPDYVENVMFLVEKLIARGATLSELEDEFSPDPTSGFTALTDKQALEIQPKLAARLNDIIKAEKEKA